MKENGRLADDVDLQELSAKSKNFSGAELEGLVRAAQSAAMARIIRPKNKVELDGEALSKLIVCRSDFLHALEHDVKPAFGASSEEIEGYFERGIIKWCPQIETVLENGRWYIEYADNPFARRVVPILLEGPPNAGKSALAATIAKMSNFPCTKLCSPKQMVGYSESAKCGIIRKIFDDAYKSHLSCVIIDQIEGLIDFTSIGPRFSNLVLKALDVLIREEPPKGRFILVLCTTSMIDALRELNLISAFLSIINVPEMTDADHIGMVIQQLAANRGVEMFTKQDYSFLAQKLKQCHIKVGIKKFIQLHDGSKHFAGGERARRFLQKLQDEGCVTPVSNHGY